MPVAPRAHGAATGRRGQGRGDGVVLGGAVERPGSGSPSSADHSSSTGPSRVSQVSGWVSRWTRPKPLATVASSGAEISVPKVAKAKAAAKVVTPDIAAHGVHPRSGRHPAAGT